MKTRDRHDEPQSPTTATQFSPPCATSYTNGVNGNHPGTLVQDGDSVRLNVAPNIGTISDMGIFDAT
jgi:enhancer of polycomb-like protein